jgi:hypothetical protein
MFEQILEQQDNICWRMFEQILEQQDNICWRMFEQISGEAGQPLLENV